ncbi:efflux RND transporter permease subunit [Vibrio tritonius]|uniref:efflux RND transporter permease subunit n=1 Tax=Vibrio tritonius TaxID=1435069 RepID=UPI00083817B7|nr:efflux RND transporter permease subunit [Vibrio tritonius]
MSRFFIDRPVFAWVIAIMIAFAGALSIIRLSVEQYPDIAPPTISIRATYTGASAQTVENSVTQVIEQKMTGLDNLVYMESSSQSNGSARIKLTFTADTDPDVAQMQVENKLQEAESKLPDSVQSSGLRVSKSSAGSFFMMLAFSSEDESLNRTDLADFMVSMIQDPVSRISGVGDVRIMGSEYAMRIWLDPAKLRHYSLMPSDITAAIKAQNTDVSAGQVGALPAVNNQALNATITSRSRLKNPDQFRNIIVKSDASGAVVRLTDVATVELGSEDYTSTSMYNGKPAASMGVELASGANAMTVAKAVEQKLNELSPYFPPGVKFYTASSTTPFVKVSIEEVVQTIFEAVVLVIAIMFLFLQNWRVTLIPAIAVPVVLLGTFGVLSMMGYSINTLTMFAMVLAIGLLVDDAIVVVENVERVMSEEGLSPAEATKKSMGQIFGALIGITLVLCAVLLPMAFFAGSTGVIYRQFSVTIISSIMLSVLVALTLTPALCATILKPIGIGEATSSPGLLKRAFRSFNTGLSLGTLRYQHGVKVFLNHRWWFIGVYVLVLVGIGVLFRSLPTAFMPEEDQGSLMVSVKLPIGSTSNKTEAVMQQVSAYVEQQPEVASVLSILGYSMGSSGQSAGMAFVRLTNWDDREASATEVGDRITKAMKKKFPYAQIFAFGRSGIPGMGDATGFEMQLEDLGGAGHEALVNARKQLIAMAAQSPLLTNVRYSSLDDAPTLNVNIDDAKAGAMELTSSDINSTLSTAFGGSYVNDFIDKGRIKKVYVQGEAQARMLPSDVYRWSVKNSDGEMVPFSAFATSSWSYSPSSLSRFNGTAAMEIKGQPAPGVSSGVAMKEMERLITQLPHGFGYSWSGVSYQERQAGTQAPILYLISVIFVFLCLAALYESWTVPLSVMLSVPIGVIGALLFTYLRGFNNDIYFQVGLLATMGLAAKNGILIVEFAKELEEQGMELVEATLEAAKLRLRPILMTSLAFLLGVFPLVISTGAGAGGRTSVGTGVFGGTLISTMFGIFFVPLFYVIVRSLFGRKLKVKGAKQGQEEVGQ